jgi:squalene-hopene/tetraprenyl-beta-curcumene cyclase
MSPVSGESADQTAVTAAIDRGLRWMKEQQAEDGSWDHYPGITALAVSAFARSPRKYREEDGPFVRRPVQFILKCQIEDGSFLPPDNALVAYNTGVCVMALVDVKNASYETAIRRARDYLVELQCDEGEGYETGDKFYGGIGYGSGLRPDLSNLQIALEALKAADLPENDPAWDKAITFLKRCQNLTEQNDLGSVANDGGFVYYPSFSYAGVTPEGGLRSYGTMTYAGLKSYIYANMNREDPRFKAALGWIGDNYTLSENPGIGQAGLYYYYLVFARTFSLLGEKTIVDGKGVSHDWYDELSTELLSRQNAQGFWQNAESSRWWEGSPSLCTAYAILALSEGSE